MENIKNRGRQYERNIQYSYLKNLQDRYFEYMRNQDNIKILILDLQNSDFVNNKSDYIRLKKIIFEKKFEIGLNRFIL